MSSKENIKPLTNRRSVRLKNIEDRNNRPLLRSETKKQQVKTPLKQICVNSQNRGSKRSLSQKKTKPKPKKVDTKKVSPTTKEVETKLPLIQLNKEQLRQLAQTLDPCQQLEEELADQLLEMGDKFIEDTINYSAKIAKNRNAAKIHVNDVGLALQMRFNMHFPEYGPKFTPKRPKRNVAINMNAYEFKKRILRL